MVILLGLYDFLFLFRRTWLWNFNDEYRMWLGQITSIEITKNIVVVYSVRSRPKKNHDE